MYGNFNFPSTSDGETHLPFTTSLPPHLLIPATTEFDSVHSSSYSTANSYNSPSSFATTSSSNSSSMKQSLIQRSVSSHSLQKNALFHCNFVDFIDSDSSNVRRVFSTGDLQDRYMQRMNLRQHSSRSCSPLSSESNMIIESMTKACPYSPEEKKERIERYRSKKNHRNFNKKIKYECRKTLADSRPRIRGRFARNEEIENTSQENEKNTIDEILVQWSKINGEEEENGYDNWINFLDSLPSNLIP
ncbi:hypothetical protein ACFE04_008049 [Oxalis oulophora]